MKSTAKWFAVGLLALSTSAFGAIVTVQWDASIFAPVGSRSGTYSTDSGATFNSVTAGRFQGTVKYPSTTLPPGTFVDSTSDFWAYCTELTQHLSGGQTINYTVGSPTARMLQWIGAVNAALGGGAQAWLHPSGPNATDIGAAIQLGLWEAVYDSSPTWDLTAGVFRANFSAGVKTQFDNFANEITIGAPSANAAQVLRLVNADLQDVVSGIPEPATLLLMGLAMALASWTLRRSRTS